MRKIYAAGLLAAGIAVMALENSNHDSRFSDERIFKRQSVLIDMHYMRRPQARDARYEQLSRSLSLHKDATRLERCIFEDNFAAETESKGNPEQAARLIARKSYQPHAHCAPSAERVYFWSRPLTMGGALAAIVGFISLMGGLVGWIAGRRKRPAEAPQKPQEPSLDGKPPQAPAEPQESPLDIMKANTKALIEIGRSNQKALVDAMDSEDPEVRRRVAEALAEVGDKKILWLLDNVIRRDPDELVTIYAKRAVEEIMRRSKPPQS